MALQKLLSGTPQHLAAEGKLNGFTYLMLNLPFKCNYRCLKCFNRTPEIVRCAGMGPDRIAAIIDEAAGLGAQVLVLSGEGEPLMDPNIRWIVWKAVSRGMMPIVYTNGSNLDIDKINFLKEKGATVVVSLDSLDSATHDKLTGTKGKLGTVLRNIEMLRAAFRDTIRTDSQGRRILRLNLNTTITSLNKDELLALKEFCSDDVRFVCNPLGKWGSAEARWNELVESDADYETHKLLARQMSESGGPLSLDSDGFCGYSRNGISVGPTGLYGCCAYTWRANGLLGKAGVTSLKDAFGKKSSVEGQTYSESGQMPCLVRSEFFGSFLEKLRQS